MDFNQDKNFISHPVAIFKESFYDALKRNAIHDFAEEKKLKWSDEFGPYFLASIQRLSFMADRTDSVIFVVALLFFDDSFPFLFFLAFVLDGSFVDVIGLPEELHRVIVTLSRLVCLPLPSSLLLRLT